MEKFIEKADILIEALPFIQRFRNETVVVKFGGSIMENAGAVRGILEDVAFMECVGLRPVLVHGGGKAISRALEDRRIESRFLQGLRVTDEVTLDIAAEVLNQQVNPGMVQMIQEFGCKARGLHGDHILSAEKHTARDPETGAVLDWGFVGNVTHVDTELVRAFQMAEIVPVITPLARDGNKQLYNVNADEVANAVAREMKARKLVYLSDVPGLLRNPEDHHSIISTVSVAEVDGLIGQGVISGGMLPKMNGALRALQAGVKKVHMIDSFMPHSLLLELFTEKGVGTEIVH